MPFCDSQRTAPTGKGDAMFCTKTPVTQCSCNNCKLFDLYDEVKWLQGMEGSGAMSQTENAARLEACRKEIHTLQGCA